MNDNPYAAPSADLVGQTDVSNAERIRTEHLKHEASVRSVGLFYYLGGALSIFAGAVILITAFTEPGQYEGLHALFIGLGLFYTMMGALAIFAGRDLRKLSARAKIPVGIVSGIGLLGVPVGTIINGYILYLVFSEKGSVVLSEEYKHMIAQTPHLKYKTPIYIWVLLALLVGLIVIGVVSGL